MRANMGTFCSNSTIHILISKRLSVKNTAKLSQLENSKHLLCSIIYFQFPVERVSICCLHVTALKLVCEFCYCYKIDPCYAH